jgi:hypothetical protein
VQHSEENKEPDTRPLRERLTYPPSQIEERYPYDEWFDGDVWRLKMYEDFYVHPGSMQSAVYQAARKRGLKVRTHIPTTEDALYIQVIKKNTKNR